ncbi:hypothetical protein BD311DRAFT_749918 [Dichomitus squalens]|uniref:Uncharacterized protein n=1 Tax=Dichomitus squalens TaxID=114155 RepID=A0A4Q9MXW7_9APHY|nr:hypothetical protein BD311DRAFT_749918 [Dichomitus squalens]
MSSSELSNALNPHVVVQRPRRRQYPTTNPANPLATPAVRHAQVPQPTAPHRSELELAMVPQEPSPPTQAAPVIQPPPPPPRHAPPVVHELYRVIASAKNAATAESRRRIAWEREQEARAAQVQAQMEQRLETVQQELSMLKAYISMHPSLAPPAEVQERSFGTIPTTARIEPVSPAPEPFSHSPMPHASPASQHISVAQPMPMFVQGASSRPLSAHGTDALYVIQESPSPSVSAPTPSIYAFQGPLTPQSDGSPTNSRTATPELGRNTRKRPRRVLEDDTDYSSDSEDSDAPPTDRPLRRKNGHDDRCLTIHHALRIHIRKMMKLKHGEDLPASAFEGVIPAVTEPVRFVWTRTTKQSAVNATMKKRIVSDIKANRHKYKHVPDNDFQKKTLEAAFEQVFTTLRQKYKSQGDATAATKLQRREDHKALKARRLHRKKTKLANRTEARNNVGAFSQPAFDSALQQDCMSSEESDGEEPAPAGGSTETMQVFRTRGLSWRSSRLLRFYAILDNQDRIDKSFRPKRGVGRRVRREGPPKDGFFLPPKGVARWMVSQKWIREMEAVRPDLTDILRELVVDPAEPEAEDARILLGPDETSDEEVVQAQPQAAYYGHVSDTSYSLYNALQPVL